MVFELVKGTNQETVVPCGSFADTGKHPAIFGGSQKRGQ